MHILRFTWTTGFLVALMATTGQTRAQSPNDPTTSGTTTLCNAVADCAASVDDDCQAGVCEPQACQSEDAVSWFDDLVCGDKPYKNVPLEFMDGFEFLSGSTLSFGGELRHRYMDEQNRIRPGGPGRTTYDLWRWRNHLDFRVGKRFGIYAEMLDASQFEEDLPVTGIDENRWNIQNLYVDVGLIDRDDKPIVFRYGRQELLYGSQQLVSPLDWSNTRRNFEGFKLSSPGEVWDMDLFATHPVNTATLINPAAVGESPVRRYRHRRDDADESRWFSGAYAVYRGIENSVFDLYWLWLETDNNLDAAVGPGSVGGDRHTLGLRWQTSKNVLNECCETSQIWKFEIEGAYQFGKDNRRINNVTARRTVQAGFLTVKPSVTFTKVAWKPTIKGVYYWGSGDRDKDDNEDNTFAQLYPLGHAYWGIIDNLSGQNMHDFSVQAIVNPTDKFKVLSALHWFQLATADDVLYNVAGVPFGVPDSSRDVGSEFDLIGTYTFNPCFNVQVGYQWFGYGDFVHQNIPRANASQLYVQTTLKY